MDDTSKYLIHAAITADGVVERSDVVGAIFGQTEGLLGEDLDLRDLQQSSKVGRIDVEVSSEGGQSFGEATIATSLDRVETAILAASLETITRVGPCRAHVEVTEIEDVREAKRRQIVERAKELLAGSFDDGVMTGGDILREVREAVRVEDIVEYDGLPAGPRVAESDAVIVVEGRSDVLTLLGYGIKNAVAVEGTDVPDAVADLTRDRTVTAFLDDDRGGELILRELAQVGDVDYVAFAPAGRSVEDLDRSEVMAALREKVPYDSLPADGSRRAAAARSVWSADGVAAREDAAGAGDGSAAGADGPGAESAPDATANDAADGAVESSSDGGEPAGTEAVTDGEGTLSTDPGDGPGSGGVPGAPDGLPDAADGAPVADEAPVDEAGPVAEDEPVADDEPAVGDEVPSLQDHVEEVIHAGTGRVRLLDGDLATLAEGDATAATGTVESAAGDARFVVLDGELAQRTLDVAAQRGIDHVVARSTGEFVKQPVSVRVLTADQLTV